MRLVPPLAYGDPVRSILLIKLDHIGDFFVSLPAMRRLRGAFHDAHITLICGPWNRQLAASANIFDEIITFDFFPEQTRNLRTHDDNREQIARLHRCFRELISRSYDLAIDLRYDTDTRRLLTMIDAKRRIGIADAGEFPFLDLAVASDRVHAAPVQPEGQHRRVEIRFANSGAPMWLTVGRKDLRLRFELDEVTSPRALGARGDERLLGLALQRARVRRRALTAAGWYPQDDRLWAEGPAYGGDATPRLEEVISFAKDAPVAAELELGFGDPEAFGLWTLGLTAQMRFPVEAGINGDLTLYLQMEGLLPRSGRNAFNLFCNDVFLARTTLDYDTRAGTLVVPITADALEAATPAALSDNFTVELGEAAIRIRMAPMGKPDLSGDSALKIEIINEVDRVLACRTLSGQELAMPGANELAFYQDDPASPLRVRVTARGRPFEFGVDLRGIQIESVSRRLAPRVHVLDWSGLIVDTAIRHFYVADDLLCMPETHLPPALEAELAADARAGRKIVIIATGANKDVTKWPLAHYSRFVSLLQQAVPCSIYFVGATREHAEAETIAGDNRQVNGHIVNACGATNLVQLTSLLKRADLFIGGSTGTTHAAAMSGVTTLALLSATNHPNQWAPVGSRANFISLDVPCRECHILFMSQCNHGYRCMIELTPELVFERALALLDSSEPHPHKPVASSAGTRNVA